MSVLQVLAEEEEQKRQQQLQVERQQREEVERFEAGGGRKRNRRHRRNLSEIEEKSFWQKFKLPLLLFATAFGSALLATYYYYN